eukprot:CAMPEP_0169100118 /NCGR_PEP_ID=MMETSP1015-20121227/20916_1 /TAXON_ID=342587 /ORGANISM="Karlodinium micrum, Strain CCMP2283" /LENGTH=763 /DNA_ID=CAMNT_0009161037 /DNA_START=131 /DNA_END=2419 /DNA_ORIENTATION=+
MSVDQASFPTLFRSSLAGGGRIQSPQRDRACSPTKGSASSIMFRSNLASGGGPPSPQRERPCSPTKGQSNSTIFRSSLPGGGGPPSPQRERASSPTKGISSADSSMYLPMDHPIVQKFQSQYSSYNKSSFGSQLPSTASQVQTDGKASTGKPTFVLTLHFLGLSGMPKAGWFERAPGYEFIVHAGGAAKRFRPRIPAPPPGVGSDTSSFDVEKCVPSEQLKAFQRLDDRLSVRMASPGEFFRVDIWEERTPLLDLGNKGATRSMLGKCYVPLESKYNRRPCTWPIVTQPDDKGGLSEVGFLTCKFGLAGMPGTVRNLRVIEGTIGATEVQLAWEPPERDGGTPLRGYRIEAREVSVEPSANFVGDDTLKTASAPPAPEPSAKLKNLNGNTVYTFCVWAVSEAGPGSGSEVQGKTAAVEPNLCGTPHLVLCDNSTDSLIQWSPPEESGGADIVAYRVWFRPLFHDSLGEQWPGESWIDLGLVEHEGEQHVQQKIPFMLHALPAQAIGCLCSISALNAAGHLGPTTPEAPIVPCRPGYSVGASAVGGDHVDLTTMWDNTGFGGSKLGGEVKDPLAQRVPPGALSASQLSLSDDYDREIASLARRPASPGQRQVISPEKRSCESPTHVLELGPVIVPKHNMRKPTAAAHNIDVLDTPPRNIQILCNSPSNAQPPKDESSLIQAYIEEASLLETEKPEAIHSCLVMNGQGQAPDASIEAYKISSSLQPAPYQQIHVAIKSPPPEKVVLQDLGQAREGTFQVHAGAWG